MKRLHFILCLLIPFTVFAQETQTTPEIPTYRITIGGRFSLINPEDINEHISTTNTILESTTKTIKSAQEVSLALTLRPMESSAILVAGASYIWIKRDFNLKVPETNNSPTITGYTSGKIKETYSAYPFSIGVGIASAEPFMQLSAEFIYALGYIKEEGNFSSSTGGKTSFSNTYFSPAYGYKITGQTTIYIIENVGLTLELGYRGLKFTQYEHEITTQPANLTFSFNGIFGLIGISVNL